MIFHGIFISFLFPGMGIHVYGLPGISLVKNTHVSHFLNANLVRRNDTISLLGGPMMQDPSILLKSSFGIVSHLQLNKWVSKFLHLSNTFSGFPLCLGALLSKFTIFYWIIMLVLLTSVYILRVALPAATTSFRCSNYCCVSSILFSQTLSSLLKSFPLFATLAPFAPSFALWFEILLLWAYGSDF